MQIIVIVNLCKAQSIFFNDLMYETYGRILWHKSDLKHGTCVAPMPLLKLQVQLFHAAELSHHELSESYL